MPNAYVFRGRKMAKVAAVAQVTKFDSGAVMVQVCWVQVVGLPGLAGSVMRKGQKTPLLQTLVEEELANALTGPVSVSSQR